MSAAVHTHAPPSASPPPAVVPGASSPRASADEGIWGYAALLTPASRWLALFAVMVAFVLPYEGFGVDLCGLHRFTGLPCPGCGLTRGFVALASGDVQLALGANPFSVVLFPLFLLLGALALLPEGMRAAVERWLAAHRGIVGRAYRVGLCAFLGFGGARFTWFLFTGEWFP